MLTIAPRRTTHECRMRFLQKEQRKLGRERKEMKEKGFKQRKLERRTAELRYLFLYPSMAKRFFFFFFFFVIFCFCFFTFCRLYMRNSIRGKFCSSFRMMAFYGVKRSILQKAQPKWMYYPSKKEIIKMSNSFQSIGAFFLRVFRISNNLPMSGSLFFYHC